MAILSEGNPKALKKSQPDCYIRNHYGKKQVCIKPRKTSRRTSAATLERREKFRLSIILSKAAAVYPEIQQIWKKLFPNAHSVFALLIKENYDHISLTGFTTDNLITPLGFPLPVTGMFFGEMILTLSISELNNCFELSGSEKKLSIIILISCRNDTVKSSKQSEIVPFYKRIEGFDFSSPASFQFDFDSRQSTLFKNSTNIILFASVITLKSDGKSVHYSATYTKILK